MEGDVSNVHREIGGHPTLPAAGNERPMASHKCRKDCMTCHQLIREKHFYSNATGRCHSVIGFNPSSVHCKMQNYIYLLTCKSCNVQYVGESIRPVNLRMNIHRTSKTGCTYSINHYTNVCPGETFSVQILEKLEGNGYKNGSIDEKMREIRLQREDYWMKTLRTVYPYGLNEKTRFMNVNLPAGKLFPGLPRNSNRYLNGRKRDKSFENSHVENLESFMKYVHNFSPNLKQNECRKVLEGTKKLMLKKLAALAQHISNTEETSDSRWYKIIIDVFLTKCITPVTKQSKKAPKYQFPIYFVHFCTFSGFSTYLFHSS